VRSVLLLAWRALSYQRLRTSVLVACLALVFFLPLAVDVLVDHYDRAMRARAQATPLVVGALGSHYDLFLSALYFRGQPARMLTMEEVAELRDSGLGTPVPVISTHSARQLPLVGTTLDYFQFRGLEIEAGRLPGLLGEAVLGARAAATLDLKPGDKLISDPEKLYDMVGSYPLRMRIVGVLAERGTPDDGAVFVDVKTAWIIGGLYHGHKETGRKADSAVVLERSSENLVFNASIVEYAEITPENIDSFHFHGDPGEFPISAILVWPASLKSATLLRGRYRVADDSQAITPTAVLDELLGFLFQIKRLYDANLVLVGFATALFFGLIVVLSLRLRAREFETLFKIGCSRRTLFALQATELAIILGLGLLCTALLAAVLVGYVLQQQVFL